MLSLLVASTAILVANGYSITNQILRRKPSISLQGWTRPPADPTEDLNDAWVVSAAAPQLEEAVKGEVSFKVKAADVLISGLFKIKPLFRLATAKARSGMIERGMKIDVDWKADIQYLEDKIETLETNFQKINKSKLIYPEYYQKPFHAYDSGNLCWQAAMEVECAALTVHSGIYTSSKDELSRDGDYLLRDKFHKNMLSIFDTVKFSPKRVLDVSKNR